MHATELIDTRVLYTADQILMSLYLWLLITLLDLGLSWVKWIQWSCELLLSLHWCLLKPLVYPSHGHLSLGSPDQIQHPPFLLSFS